MMENKVTLQDATSVASILMNAPTVLGVELIGSVARTGTGNDLDLVVVVGGIRYTSYVVAVRQQFVEGYSDNFYADFADERLAAALDTIALPPIFKTWLRTMTKSFKLDIHVMPKNWQQFADQVQQHLPHEDENFVSNIAKDARPFTTTVSDDIKCASISTR